MTDLASAPPLRRVSAHRRLVSSITVVVTVLVLVVTGCSSSDDPADQSSTSTAIAAGDEPLTPAVTEQDSTEPSADAETEAMTIETNTGESWTLEQFRCIYSPDNEGAFVQLWSAGGTLANGGEFLVQETTSPDPAAPLLMPVGGTFVDDDAGIVYVVVEGTAVSDGSTMTMTLGMHDSPNKLVGDPIDLTATVTCSL